MAGAQAPVATLKAEALHALLVARLLFEKARETCFVDERHTASAGLTILQDALELVLYALLIQLGVDETRSIENLKFDELLGLLRSEIKVPIPKSGTLKALNKQRNLIKHAGQLADPTTVRNYYDNAFFAVDRLLSQLLGRRLQDIASSDMVIDSETREFIADAERLINERDYAHALFAIRKALFIEVLQAYAVDGFKFPGTPISSLMMGRGSQAPYYARDSEWIDANVKTPYDLVQLDTNAVRLDLFEWGVSTQDFWNLMHLTPRAFRYANSKEWVGEISFPLLPTSESEANARFCLDRIVSLVIKKQSHFQLARRLGYRKPSKFELPESKRLYEKASVASKVVKVLGKGTKWSIAAIVGGLDPTNQQFLEIDDMNFASNEPTDFITRGYVLIDFELKVPQGEED